MATHECTWYNLDMLRKGFSAVPLILANPQIYLQPSEPLATAKTLLLTPGGRCASQLLGLEPAAPGVFAIKIDTEDRFLK